MPQLSLHKLAVAALLRLSPAVMMVCGFVLAWQKFAADPDMVADS
jgi:hypothetical protein